MDRKTAIRVINSVDELIKNGEYTDFAKQMLMAHPKMTTDVILGEEDHSNPLYQVWIRNYPDQKIPAIKFYRSMTGDGLADAKMAVENPLTNKAKPLFKGTKRQCEEWVQNVRTCGVHSNWSPNGIGGYPFVNAPYDLDFDILKRD